MRNKLFTLVALVVALGSSAGTASAQDVLTGDTRLACEAILCLSTGTRPSRALAEYNERSRREDEERRRQSWLN